MSEKKYYVGTVRDVRTGLCSSYFSTQPPPFYLEFFPAPDSAPLPYFRPSLFYGKSFSSTRTGSAVSPQKIIQETMALEKVRETFLPTSFKIETPLMKEVTPISLQQFKQPTLEKKQIQLKKESEKIKQEHLLLEKEASKLREEYERLGGKAPPEIAKQFNEKVAIFEKKVKLFETNLKNFQEKIEKYNKQVELENKRQLFSGTSLIGKPFQQKLSSLEEIEKQKQLQKEEAKETKFSLWREARTEKFKRGEQIVPDFKKTQELVPAPPKSFISELEKKEKVSVSPLDIFVGAGTGAVSGAIVGGRAGGIGALVGAGIGAGSTIAYPFVHEAESQFFETIHKPTFEKTKKEIEKSELITERKLAELIGVSPKMASKISEPLAMTTVALAEFAGFSALGKGLQRMATKGGFAVGVVEKTKIKLSGEKFELSAVGKGKYQQFYDVFGKKAKTIPVEFVEKKKLVGSIKPAIEKSPELVRTGKKITGVVEPSTMTRIVLKEKTPTALKGEVVIEKIAPSIAKGKGTVSIELKKNLLPSKTFTKEISFFEKAKPIKKTELVFSYSLPEKIVSKGKSIISEEVIAGKTLASIGRGKVKEVFVGVPEKMVGKTSGKIGAETVKGMKGKIGFVSLTEVEKISPKIGKTIVSTLAEKKPMKPLYSMEKILEIEAGGKQKLIQQTMVPVQKISEEITKTRPTVLPAFAKAITAKTKQTTEEKIESLFLPKTTKTATIQKTIFEEKTKKISVPRITSIEIETVSKKPITSTAVLPKIKAITSTGIREKVVSTTEEKIESLFLPKTITSAGLQEQEREKTTTALAPLFGSLEKTRTASKTATKMKTADLFFEVPAIPTTKPVFAVPPFLIERKKRMQKKFFTPNLNKMAGFIPFVKTKKKWVPASKEPLPLITALSRGGKIADIFSAKTFALKKTKKPAKPIQEFGWFSIQHKFYRKGEKFIEKPKYAIDMPEEIKEIPYKGAWVRKMKKKRWWF